MTDSTFRGYHAIKEVIEYLKPLAEWMERFKPEQRELTLKRTDFDLLKRWPKAAAIFDVSQSREGGLSYRGFALKFDKKPTRYPRDEMAAT